MELIQQHLSKLIPIFQHHHVNTVFVFGSVLTKKFNSASDIDLVVEFLPANQKNYADNYFELHEKLETLLGKKVDLLEAQAIRNPYIQKEIDRTKRLIYAYGNKELAL